MVGNDLDLWIPRGADIEADEVPDYVSAIFQKREDPDDYVAECYLKKTYMAIYSNLIMPVNGMDLWLRGEGPAMLPPQYTRQPGRPKTVRIKDSLEKAQGSGTKLGRVQKSLKCGNCGVLGHNMKTCHRHLPPKEKSSAFNKRRKLNNGEGSETQQTKKGTKTTLTKNELRKKAKETTEYQRKKMASMKASRAAGTKSAPIGSRSVPPPPVPTRPPPTASSRPVQSSQASSTKAANPTRTSQRIRQNSGRGGGK